MALVKRRVANPVPSVLALINPGGKKMAAKKKSSSTRRVNAAPKRQHTALVRTSHTAAHKRNSPRKHHPRRRHNPVKAGIFVEGGKLAISGALIGIGQPIVRSFVGPYLGTSPIASAGLTFGTAWLLSMVSRATTLTKKLEDPLLLSGATIAAAQLLSTYVLPLLRPGGAATSPLVAGLRGSRQMGDLVTLPAGNFDPYYGSTPRIAGSTVATAPAPNGGSQAAKLKGLITMAPAPARNGASYYQTYGR